MTRISENEQRTPFYRVCDTPIITIKDGKPFRHPGGS